MSIIVSESFHAACISPSCVQHLQSRNASQWATCSLRHDAHELWCDSMCFLTIDLKQAAQKHAPSPASGISMEMLVDHDTVKCHTYTLLFSSLDLRATLRKPLARAAPFQTIECILDKVHGCSDLFCCVEKKPGHITCHSSRLWAPPWRLRSGYV